ncbi:MAG: LuxR C-terminal-related transcriptional regulator [Sporichthyaceae bacterium]|nr:LuxR C-terminal-related transcriptional regulator [Sporichthyaceae bacterium]
MAALLPDKIAVPRIDVDLLPRPRLWARLDAAPRCRAVVVAGPAGSGKTVACASWAIARPGPGRLAWVTLDAGDRERERFWEYVLAALGEIGQEPPAGDVTAGACPAGLLSRLAAADGPVTLVLDELDQIGDSPVMADLDFLLRHAPRTFRVILIGRRMPPLQTARLRLAGLVDVIGPAELACTAEEAEQLVALQGITLDPAELSGLWELTEGWIGGLRLEVLGGDVAAEYIRDEFIARLEPADRELLRRTSVADQLTADLAGVLGGVDGAARLDQLSHDCGLVQRLTGDQARFRYHPMLRRVLRAELEREQPQSVADLYRALGRWHERHGRPDEALHCAVAAGDSSYLAQLLLDDDVYLLASDATAGIEQVLINLGPDPGADDPATLTAIAAARLRRGDLDETRALLRRASAGVTTLSSGPAAVVRLKQAALRLALAVREGTPCSAAQTTAWQLGERGSDAVPRPPAERRACGWLMATLGISHLASGELRPARLALTAAEREFAAAGPSHLRERVCAWLALGEATEGRLRSAARYAEQVAVGGAASGLARAALVIASVERGEPARAAELLAEIEPWPAEPLLAEPEPALVMHAAQLSVRLAQGDLAGAGAALALLPVSAGTYGDRLAPAFAVHDATIAIRAQADPAKRLDAVDWTDCDRSEAIWPVGRDLVLAWHAAGDDPASALRIVTPLRGLGTDGLRLRDQISVRLVSAVASWRLGERDVATRQLADALALAEPETARQVFVDAGPGARALLTVAIPVDSRFAGFRAEILERFERLQTTFRPRSPAAGELTSSEHTVLRYLPSHLTNEEIAADLCLSVNTVKTHVRSIYRKLSVSSRRAAIAAADRHGLLLAGSRLAGRCRLAGRSRLTRSG